MEIITAIGLRQVICLSQLRPTHQAFLPFLSNSRNSICFKKILFYIWSTMTVTNRYNTWWWHVTELR